MSGVASGGAAGRPLPCLWGLRPANSVKRWPRGFQCDKPYLSGQTTMHVALSRQDHRPWPIPGRRWTWRQSWRDLLFAHWAVPTTILRPLVPRSLDLQEFEGTAWLGLVPFRMTGVMRRPLPDLPWVSAFPEINVRTYVDIGGRPGIWFLSLDAASALAVWAARRFFHLPYYQATMTLVSDGDAFRYSSVRAGAELSASYSPTSGHVQLSRHRNT